MGFNEDVLAKVGAAPSPGNLAFMKGWVAAEGGPGDNPLNIGPGQHFSDPAGATAQLIMSGYQGIANGLRSDAGCAALAALPDLDKWSTGSNNHNVVAACTGGTGGSGQTGGAPQQPGAAASSGPGIFGIFKSIFGIDPIELFVRSVEVVGGSLILASGLVMVGLVVVGPRKAASAAVSVTPLGRGAKLGGQLVKGMAGSEAKGMAAKAAGGKAEGGAARKAASNVGTRQLREVGRQAVRDKITAPDEARSSAAGSSRRTGETVSGAKEMATETEGL